MTFRKDAVDEYYDILDEIGTGHFATVKKCRDKVTGKLYAGKLWRRTLKYFCKCIILDLIVRICLLYECTHFILLRRLSLSGVPMHR